MAATGVFGIRKFVKRFARSKALDFGVAEGEMQDVG